MSRKQNTDRSATKRRGLVDWGNQVHYVFFLIFLTMVYIGNAHLVEKKVREIDRLKREIRELNWRYMSAESDAIYEGTYSRLSRQLEGAELSSGGALPVKLKKSQ